MSSSHGYISQQESRIVAQVSGKRAETPTTAHIDPYLFTTQPCLRCPVWIDMSLRLVYE